MIIIFVITFTELGKATLREWALILYGTAEDPEAQLRSDFPDKLLGEIDQGNDLGGNEGSSGVRSTGVRDREYNYLLLTFLMRMTCYLVVSSRSVDMI